MRINHCINDVLTEEIYLFMNENFLKYETSFFASTSEFWWDRVFNKSFGACIGKSMANIYTFDNGLYLFIFDTMMKSVYKDALQYPTPTFARYQALLDFVHFENLTQVITLSISLIQYTREFVASRLSLEVIWLVVPTMP